MNDHVDVVHQQFINKVAASELPRAATSLTLAESTLSANALIQIFKSQVLSRQLDRIGKRMQAKGEGFYTIGSSGHEGLAAVAAAFRFNDMAFLHYRDAAFQIQRATQIKGQNIAEDMLLSFAASADDPISGGRHKVLGSKALFIPPQTSTIASHLPKAVGAAFSVGLAKRLQPTHQALADDGLILCSFGDASANHSTAQGAINSASWTAYQGAPMPIVFICEDNGLGISTRTPAGWIEAAFSARPSLKYMQCNGLDVLESYQVAQQAQAYARKTRKPVFIHMRCVRLYGHAGPDAQSVYLTPKEIKAAEQNDPLLYTASILIDQNILSSKQILQIYQQTEVELLKLEEKVIARPKLKDAKAVMKSIIPPKRAEIPASKINRLERETLFGRDMVAMKKPQHMARLISWALTDLMAQHAEIVLAGEDIGPKGGVYNVTVNLHARFGANRVINTLLDEQSILGLAIGLAHNGFLPIPEIQFLAYVHNAEDQIRGEAATLSFFSNGQFTNPMVIRVAGLAYQKGFGGHFHNDNSIAVLRDIPGVIIACPSNGEDAVLMLRECVRLAQVEQRVVVFLEPIALYMTRDLHTKGDGLWMVDYSKLTQQKPISLGQIGQHGKGKELLIITYGNGYFLSRQAQTILANEHDIAITVINLRWLAPLPEKVVLAAAKNYPKILIVDECRKTGSISEQLMSLLIEQANHSPSINRITAEDSFIALGKSATVTLPSCEGIVQTAMEMIEA